MGRSTFRLRPLLSVTGIVWLGAGFADDGYIRWFDILSLAKESEKCELWLQVRPPLHEVLSHAIDKRRHELLHLHIYLL